MKNEELRVKREEGRGRTVGTVAVMMGATVLSKVLGMLRGVLFASHYGTGTEADAFSAASQIPLSAFDILCSAAILGCFIPIYNSFHDNEEKEKNVFASQFLSLILLVTGALALLGIIFARPIISVMTPGLSLETKAMAAKLLAIMFPMIIFTGSAYTLVGVLQSSGRYILPALISSVSNAGVIIYFLFFDSACGVYGLAAAYLAAWLLQLATLLIPLLCDRFTYRPGLSFKNTALRRAIKAAPPIMIGSWLLPVGVMSGNLFASLTGESGNVTVFTFANNLYIIAAGILTYSICNYIFPKLSRLTEDTDGFSATVRTGILSSAAIIVPFMAGLMILSGEGTAAVYMRSEFTPESARQTAQVFKLMVLGMPGFALIEILTRTFYAKGIYKLPMLGALTGIGVNVLSSAALLGAGLGVYGVGLANALGQTAMAAVLAIALGRKLHGIFDRSFFIKLIKIILSGIAALAVMLIVYRFTGSCPYESGTLQNILTCAVTFVPGAAVYLLLLRIFGGLKRD